MLTVTIKESFVVSIPVSTVAINYNIRPTSIDLGVGSFVGYTSTDSAIISSLGQMFNLVSFP